MKARWIKRVIWKTTRYRGVRYFLYSILLLFIVLEVGLRIAGSLLYPPIEEALEPVRGSSTFKIVCVGDSHTYGMDAPRHLSYPRQLANLLNSRSESTVYEVANLGVPGFNSSETYQRLKEAIHEEGVQPDLVIMCAGHNNTHNLRHAPIWKIDSMKTASPEQQIRHLLEYSRSYKLGLITWLNLKKLAYNPDQKKILNSVLLEKDLMTSWLIHDFEQTADLVNGTGGSTLFMNYHFTWDYINESLKHMELTHDIPYVDVEGFRMGIGRGLTGRTGHPNEKGYAAIARFVHDTLMTHGLIPDSPHHRPISGHPNPSRFHSAQSDCQYGVGID